MKLDRLTSLLAATGLAAAFACGCSATVSHAPQTASANAGNVAGTTNLMSAELAGPAPRVGKAHSTIANDRLSDESFDTSTSDDESAPKEARRSDGSHRGGSFGTASK